MQVASKGLFEVRFRSSDRENDSRAGLGALVIGGEHPGLGIARSLGRRGIPVYVVDDQHSVSRFSRYVHRVIHADDLLDERKTIETFSKWHRYGLQGWVLFPTRDETVAAFSRYRRELEGFFRLTTPDWKVARWALDKRNTYNLALQLKFPSPQTWSPLRSADLGTLYDKLPLAIKPAIKENFFYSTGAKAWRANTPEQLHLLFEKATRLIDPEEVMVQEIIPWRRAAPIFVLRIFPRRPCAQQYGGKTGTTASARIRARSDVCRKHGAPDNRGAFRASAKSNQVLRVG